MEDYQKCLKEGKKILEAEAVLVTYGMKVLMKCHYCAHPNESVSRIWRVAYAKTATYEIVKLDGKRTRILSDLSLLIIKPKDTDSGMYYCNAENKLYARYNLEIVEEEPHHIIRQIKKNSFQLKNVTLPDKNLIIASKWSNWSKCDRCGKVGRRRRIGICTVRKVRVNKPTFPVNENLLSVYRNGIPCRSKLLPKAIRNLQEIKERKSEFLVGFCKKSCPTPPPIEYVTNKLGQIIAIIDRSKGEYSLRDRLPTVPPIVARETIYQSEGSYLKLECPGNTGVYLTWRNESWVLNPSYVHIKTKGRVMIDFINTLHIRQLRASDTAVYSCWEDNRLVGTVRLYVTSPIPRKEVSISALNLCLLATFLVILYVTIMVIKNRKLTAEA
ncbi:Ig-like V-type domain-containing protein FAM187A isoform X2 [Centruroides sculpturatus]|nr:Ig-like V-type domain-containing protein FAM187A isoform X2 [Centruroides sculpturatus]